MSGSGDSFAEDIAALEKVRQLESTDDLCEYTGKLAESGEQVRIKTLAPELADVDAVVDAFTQVSDQWYNASANANIRPIRERGTEPRPWIALPDDNTETLATVQPDLSPDALETVIAETAEALRTLGLYNTVHGHLIPDDIYLPNGAAEGEELTVELDGFGLEATIRTAVDGYEPTAYTAPELVDGANQPTEQTDVYGLGAVTYFALTGHAPVAGADLPKAISDGPTNRPSTYADGIRAEVDDVVMRALSPSPADRYESPYAFHRAFLSVFDPDALKPDDTDEDGGDEATAADASESTDATPDEADDESPSDEEEDFTESDDTDGRSVTRRAAVGLLGVVIFGGGGWYLSQVGTPPSEQGPTESPTSVQSPTATLTPTPAQTSIPTDTPTQTPTEIPTQVANFAPDDGDSIDEFGWSVTLSSDGATALIGAVGDEDPNGPTAGSAYVFDNSNSSWTQQAKLAPDDGDSDDEFGYSVALSSDGDTALIGAPADEDPNGTNAGSAYLFDSSGGAWTQQAKLAANDGDNDDEFGYSVALSSDGTTALVGAVFDAAYSAYVFDSSGGSWTQQVKLTPEGDSGFGFGSSVALSSDGDTALIGARYDDEPNGNSAGAAYVFDSSGGSWTQQAKLVADDGDSDDWFGGAVALSGDGSTALIGAYKDENPNGSEGGSAYVFDSSGSSWSQQAKVTPADGDSDDDLGQSVALSSDGSTALIGAPGDEDPNVTWGGSAYVFDRSGGSWTQEAKLAANDGDIGDRFGNSVTLSSDASIALIGAYRDAGSSGSSAGTAYVFE